MLIDTVFIELALYLSCIITGFKAVTAAVQRQMIYLKVHPLPVPDHPRGLRNSVALDPQARLVVINALTCLSRHRLYDIMLTRKTTNTLTNSTTIPYDFLFHPCSLIFPSVKVWSAPKKTDNS
jgi:hypothetical protein